MDTPIERTFWQKRRRAIVGGAVVLALLLVGVVVIGRMAARTVRVAGADITVSTARRGAFHDIMPLRAKAVPHDVVLLDAVEGGRVDAVLAQPGDPVTAGQPLVRLSNSSLELDVLEREARIIESITQLQTFQTSLEQSRLANGKALAAIRYDVTRLSRSLGRRAVLAANGAETPEYRDQVSDELAYTRAILPMQQQSNRVQDGLRNQELPQIAAQIGKLQQDLVVTRNMRDNLLVRAPDTGRVTTLTPKTGENLSRGQKIGEVQLATGYKVVANVDEYYLGRIRKGQRATVQVDGQAYAAHVTRIYPQVTEGVFNVDLDFDGAAPPALTPGQALQGQLALGADIPAVLLPAGPFLERSGGDWVFVVDPDGRTARRRRITVGRRNSEQVQVTGGLAPGEEVVTSDYTGLERADRIRITR
jgi:HlyD family secretion protein